MKDEAKDDVNDEVKDDVKDEVKDKVQVSASVTKFEGSFDNLRAPYRLCGISFIIRK